MQLIGSHSYEHRSPKPPQTTSYKLWETRHLPDKIGHKIVGYLVACEKVPLWDTKFGPRQSNKASFLLSKNYDDLGCFGAMDKPPF